MQKILDEIYNALPKLLKIKDTAKNTETIPANRWDSRIKSIFKSNLRKYGEATTPAGLEYWFHPCIITHHIISDKEVLIELNREKYLLIRKYVTSEENHK